MMHAYKTAPGASGGIQGKKQTYIFSMDRNVYPQTGKSDDGN